MKRHKKGDGAIRSMSGTISVTVEANGNSSRRSLKSGSTAGDLLDFLELLPDAYIVVRNNRPIPITQVLEGGDRIHIIKVASGG